MTLESITDADLGRAVIVRDGDGQRPGTLSSIDRLNDLPLMVELEEGLTLPFAAEDVEFA